MKLFTGGVALLLALPSATRAQMTIGARITPVFTYADPSAGGTSRGEVKLVAPLLFGMLHADGGRLGLHVMLDGEGLTMPGGELSTGSWGEGFFDRRHPHTWAHEVMGTAQDLVRLPGVSWSISAGKGFAPYGTDDPMNRPTLLFPVNHHWSQVLERAVAIAGLSAGPVTIEGGLFNGDEPEKWDAWPNWSRFGDSWSLRALIRAAPGVELQASRAKVKSPEHRQGAGLEHTLTSFSATMERGSRAGAVYAHAEYGHADEEGAYAFSSILAEAQLLAAWARPYLRFERTDRPEELRLVGDDYRTFRPHNESSNLGTTRWTTLTFGAGRGLPRLGPHVALEGIVEVEYLHVTNVTGVVFDPAFFYGRNDLWSFSVGIQISAGTSMHRMGRYGVASPAADMHSHMNPME